VSGLAGRQVFERVIWCHYRAGQNRERERAARGKGTASCGHGTSSPRIERVRDIVTNQGDSEVILVEGGTVYYRASDRLYSAVITEAGLGPARLLVAGEAIRDAHWAFFRH